MATYIYSRADIVSYLDNSRMDLTDLGTHYTVAVCDQIQASDHPPWGDDWEEWLEEWIPSLIEETIDGLDRLA